MRRRFPVGSHISASPLTSPSHAPRGCPPAFPGRRLSARRRRDR
jgi:hypothetical protein